jgi:hypothetical protein
MSSKIVAVYSNVFLENHSSSWSASPSTRLLGDLHRGIDSARWIAVICGPAGEIRIALGDPVPYSSRTNDLYIPPWLLSSIGVEGVGEELVIRFERCEDMPKASRLVFTYLGELPADIDMRELLETPLSQLGVLSRGQIIPAPVIEGSLIITQCEPEGVPVFLDGLEVAFEIEGDKKESIIPAPVIEPLPVEETSMSGMLPASLLQQTYTPPNTGRFACKSSFIPFSGQGRTLGS